jgi:hydroxyacylglutathione hydrolase
MILKQYYLGCLAHASYLLGDEATTTAIIVDPQRDIQQYVADTEKLGLHIRHVFLTHFHADFIAGHLELRDRCGATIYLGARAKAEYPFVPMADGDTLDFPTLRLQVLETPGHTIESISILVFDLQKDPTNPHAVLTGDTLFIYTTPCTTSYCPCPMKRWSTPRMAQALSAASSYPPIPSPRWEISAV